MSRLVYGFLVASLITATAYAQHEHAAPTAAAQPAAAEPASQQQELFCSTMKTGQLCTHGTLSALGLTGEKGQAWLAAVQKYNKAVNDATVALQAEARSNLTPAQMAEVERWFAVGLNQQMNGLLAASATIKGAR